MTLQLVRVGAFLGLVALVYYLAFRWAWARWRGAPSDRAFARAFRHPVTGAVLLGAGAVGLVCMAYGFFVEPTQLAVTFHEIRTAKLPAGARVRIVHLADFHVRENGPRERRLPALVRDLRPDLILHTGDFFARQGVEPVVSELLRSWDVPQYASEGNLDRLGDFRRIMREGHVQPLHQKQVLETVGGASLCITGFSSGAEGLMGQALADLPEDTFNVVLYHHPQGFPRTWGTAADLMLAGHTHGGQVCLPFYGALVTLDRYGKRWESGRYEERGVHLVVSRGIGCEPHVPEVRFWCAPEVVVIDLVGTG